MQLLLGERPIDCTDRTAIMGILHVSDDSPIARSIPDPGRPVEPPRGPVSAGADPFAAAGHRVAGDTKGASAF